MCAITTQVNAKIEYEFIVSIKLTNVKKNFIPKA